MTFLFSCHRAMAVLLCLLVLMTMITGCIGPSATPKPTPAPIPSTKPTLSPSQTPAPMTGSMPEPIGNVTVASILSSIGIGAYRIGIGDFYGDNAKDVGIMFRVRTMQGTDDKDESLAIVSSEGRKISTMPTLTLGGFVWGDFDGSGRDSMLVRSYGSLKAYNRTGIERWSFQIPSQPAELSDWKNVVAASDENEYLHVAELDGVPPSDVVYTDRPLIYAIRGSDGKQIFKANVLDYYGPGSQKPNGIIPGPFVDLDNDGRTEIVMIAEFYNYPQSDTTFDILVIGANGNLRWKYSINGMIEGGAGFVEPRILITDDQNSKSKKVFIVGPRETILLNGSDGSVIWKKGFIFLNSPLPMMVDLYGDGVEEVIGASGAYLSYPKEISVVNSITGELAWKTSLTNDIYGFSTMKTPEGGTGIFCATDKTYALLDGKGKVIWEHPWKEPAFRIDGINVSDSMAFVSIWSASNTSKVYAIQRDGSIRWMYELPSRAWIIAVADLNNDGEPDVVLNPSYEPVYALDGKTGKSLWKFGLGSLERLAAFRMGDINNTVVLLYNNDYLTSGYDKVVWPNSGRVLNEVRATVGDVNRDNVQEVIVADSEPGVGYSVRLLDYQGVELWKQTTSSNFFELLDVNHDGRLEILIQENETYTLLDWRGSEIGTYKSPDGNPMIFKGTVSLQKASPEQLLFSTYVQKSQKSTLALFNRSGALSWVYQLPERFMLQQYAVADVNGDSRNEIVINGTISNVSPSDRPVTKLFVLDSDGKVLWNKEHDGGAFSPALVDFDQDNSLDILIVWTYSKNLWMSEIAVLKGSSGDVITSMPIDGYRAMLVDDIDNDGTKEILVVSSANLNVFRNSFDKPLWSAKMDPPPESLPILAVADLNGDKKDEIILSWGNKNIGNYSGSYFCLINSDGIMISKTTLPANESPLSKPMFADLNNDGAKEIITASNNNVYTFNSKGQLLWKYQGWNSGHNLSEAMALVDVDSDGAAEVLAPTLGENGSAIVALKTKSP